jgi:hypothetical protein
MSETKPTKTDIEKRLEVVKNKLKKIDPEKVLIKTAGQIKTAKGLLEDVNKIKKLLEKKEGIQKAGKELTEIEANIGEIKTKKPGFLSKFGKMITGASGFSWSWLFSSALPVLFLLIIFILLLVLEIGFLVTGAIWAVYLAHKFNKKVGKTSGLYMTLYSASAGWIYVLYSGMKHGFSSIYPDFL